MNGVTSVTYNLITDQQLEKLLRQAARPLEMIKKSEAIIRYNLSKESLGRLEESGKLKQYRIPEYRGVFYRVADVENLYKEV